MGERLRDQLWMQTYYTAMLSEVPGVAAVTCISTKIAGRAISACTVARAGLLSGSTHSHHTSFMAAKSAAMSRSHILQVRSRDLSVPASVRIESIFSRIAAVCAAASPASGAT